MIFQSGYRPGAAPSFEGRSRAGALDSLVFEALRRHAPRLRHAQHAQWVASGAGGAGDVVVGIPYRPVESARYAIAFVHYGAGTSGTTGTSATSTLCPVGGVVSDVALRAALAFEGSQMLSHMLVGGNALPRTRLPDPLLPTVCKRIHALAPTAPTKKLRRTVPVARAPSPPVSVVKRTLPPAALDRDVKEKICAHVREVLGIIDVAAGQRALAAYLTSEGCEEGVDGIRAQVRSRVQARRRPAPERNNDAASVPSKAVPSVPSVPSKAKERGQTRTA
jgi:hypothetical protein